MTGSVMADNLFISYVLHDRQRHDEAVVDCIHTLGDWAQVDHCLWYVHSYASARFACDCVWTVMSAADTLLVIDATNNEIASENIDPEVAQFMRDHWHRHPSSSRHR